MSHFYVAKVEGIGAKPTTIAQYMPANFAVIGVLDGITYIGGTNFAGWTFEDYVRPRLASGLYSCTEVEVTEEVDAMVRASQAELVDDDGRGEEWEEYAADQRYTYGL